MANRAARVDGYAAAGNVNDSITTKTVVVAACAPAVAVTESVPDARGVPPPANAARPRMRCVRPARGGRIKLAKKGEGVQRASRYSYIYFLKCSMKLACGSGERSLVCGPCASTC